MLLSSYYFYMCWKPEYAFLIVASTAIDYYTGMRMSVIQDKRKRKPFLMLSIFTNLSLLVLFKYFNFFSESANSLFASFNIFYDVPEFNLFLPVGISFYTFQTLSYSIDVYRGNTKAEKHFGHFALFVSYWPQLVAGPIERHSDLAPQLKQKFDFNYDRIKQGLVRILWGFFKKVVVADRLSIFVQEVYQHPGEHGGFAVVLATWMFAFQVYCDFSGYCDIAIGSSKIMGVNLNDNFKTPYFSRTVREFWQRWHITLSVWIRDYLYFPLGGSKVTYPRLMFNTMFTFTIMGLWHGANWTFIWFGVIHGAMLSIRRTVDKFLPNLKLDFGPKLKWLAVGISMFFVFNVTCIPDIFFCSSSGADAITHIQSIFTVPNTTGELIHNSITGTDTSVQFILSWVFIAVLLFFDFRMYTNSDGTIEDLVTSKSTPVRWAFYIVILLFVGWFAMTTNSAFIYFQF
jgi:alginate O-acetyltransferase complex protein AlgI